MAGVRIKLYRGRQYAVWTEAGRTRRRALRTTDPGVAERRLDDLVKAPAAGTVADMMGAYLAELDARAARPDRARDAWKALAPEFGHLRPDQISRQRCRAYIDKRRAAGRADGTIHKELSVLRTGLKWARPDNGALYVLPSPPPPRDRALTRDEYARLLAACAPHHLRLFVILALATAGRAGALLELTWDRVDFERGLIDLRSFGERRKGRAAVPMTRTARAALSAARNAARTPYVIDYADRPIASVKKSFATACRASALEGVTPHVLRHTAAVWMAEAGTPMSEIAQYLGHDNDRVTQRVYARYSPEHLRGAAAALETHGG